MSDPTRLENADLVRRDRERLRVALENYSHSSLLQMLDALRIKHDETTRKVEAISYLASFLGTAEHVAQIEGRVSPRQWNALAHTPFAGGAVTLRSLKVRLAALGAPPAGISADLQALLTCGAIVIVGVLTNKEKTNFSERSVESDRYSQLAILSPPLVVDAAARIGKRPDVLSWRTAAPTTVRSAGFVDLQRDVYLALRATAEGRLRVTAKGVPFKLDVAKLAAPPAPAAGVKGKARKAPTAPASPRLWFALALLMSSPLVDLSGTQLAQTDEGRAFLRSTPTAQAKTLFGAYLECVFSEFFRLPDLSIDYLADPDVAWADPMVTAYGISDTPTWPRLQQARAAIVAALQGGAASENGWLASRALLTTIRADHPEFLVSSNSSSGRSYWSSESRVRYYEGIHRPGRSYPDNLIRRDDNWDEVEGAFVIEALREPLHWLGLVDLGLDGTGQLVAFRLTPLGRHVLLGEPAPADERPTGGAPGLVVQPNFDLIVLDASGSLSLLAQLDDFADRITLDRAATFRLTRESVVRGLDRGLSGAEIAATLERESGVPLPQNIAYSISEWARLFERIHVRRAAALLVAKSAAELDQWLAEPDLQGHFGARLSPTTVLVPDRSRLAVQARLKHAGRGSRTIDYNQPQRKLFQVRAPATVELDPKRAEPYVRFRLSRFADPAPGADPANPVVYQITADSTRRAIKDGVKIDDITLYLVNGTTGLVPTDTLLRIRGWGGVYSPLRQAEVVAVQLPPGLSWPVLAEIPEVRAGLIRAATPMVGLIRPERFAALREALAERGLVLEDGITDADGVVRSTGSNGRANASPIDELREIVESLANGSIRNLKGDLATLAALADFDPDLDPD